MNNRWKQILPYLAIPLLLIAMLLFLTTRQQPEKLAYYEVIELFEEDQVSEFTLNLSSGELEYRLKGDDTGIRSYTVPNVSMFIDDIHDHVKSYNESVPENQQIKYDYLRGSSNSWWVSLLPTVILMAVLGIAMYVMMRKMNQTITSETNRTISFGKARIRNGKDEKRKTTFADVAGADEEKAELQEIVDLLRDPSRFHELGARIPKGVLLVGPPGTGKTLLARAVAGEADVPFFSISGSDFLEMYVGVGASRVRDLFDQAKKNAPSIIFIDEIDAVGRHRGAGMGGGHDEREQTLNQMLVEMDGFGYNEGVVVIAATNRPDILDPALLRPGRFDRQVTVGLPDVKGRTEILKVHAKKPYKPLAPDVKLEEIAKSTVGFTGADLENLLNEAALLAARRKKKAISMNEIEEATMKVIVGTEKKSHKRTMEDKRITAYHEAGHAIATHFQDGQDPVQHVSIVPRGMAAGFTLSRPEQDSMHVSRQYLLDEIVVLLGGRVSEELFIGDICTGASNDIERATEMARNMVTKYGMSDSLGPINYGSGDHEVFLGKDYGNIRNYSEAVAAEIDEEINRIIHSSYKRCEEILKAHSDKLKQLAEYLIEYEKIDGDDFRAMMEGRPFTPPTLSEESSPEKTQTDPPAPDETAQEPSVLPQPAQQPQEPSANGEPTENPSETPES